MEYTPEYTPTMNFGQALEALKQGKRVQRNAMHTSSAGSFDMQPCIGMKTAQGTMQPGWLASQPDMLSNDWAILD